MILLCHFVQFGLGWPVTRWTKIWHQSTYVQWLANNFGHSSWPLLRFRAPAGLQKNLVFQSFSDGFQSRPVSLWHRTIRNEFSRRITLLRISQLTRQTARRLFVSHRNFSLHIILSSSRLATDFGHGDLPVTHNGRIERNGVRSQAARRSLNMRRQRLKRLDTGQSYQSIPNSLRCLCWTSKVDTALHPK